MFGYKDYVKWKLLSEVIDKMTDEERAALFHTSKADRNHSEIMEALQDQREQISRVSSKVEKQSWLTDFASDIAANFTTDGIIWLASRLLRR